MVVILPFLSTIYADRWQGHYYYVSMLDHHGVSFVPTKFKTRQLTRNNFFLNFSPLLSLLCMEFAILTPSFIALSLTSWSNRTSGLFSDKHKSTLWLWMNLLHLNYLNPDRSNCQICRVECIRILHQLLQLCCVVTNQLTWSNLWSWHYNLSGETWYEHQLSPTI